MQWRDDSDSDDGRHMTTHVARGSLPSDGVARRQPFIMMTVEATLSPTPTPRPVSQAKRSQTGVKISEQARSFCDLYAIEVSFNGSRSRCVAVAASSSASTSHGTLPHFRRQK